MDNTQIQNIIKQRKKGSLWGAVIVSGVLTYMAFKQEADLKVVIIVILLVLIPILITYLVNFFNYPDPSKGYRKFNKIVYVYSARVFRVLFFIEALINLKRTLNPFENYKNPGNPSHLEYLTNTAGSGYMSHVMGKQAKSGDIVEEYYKQKEKAQTNISPPPEAKDIY